MRLVLYKTMQETAQPKEPYFYKRLAYPLASHSIKNGNGMGVSEYFVLQTCLYLLARSQTFIARRLINVSVLLAQHLCSGMAKRGTAPSGLIVTTLEQHAHQLRNRAVPGHDDVPGEGRVLVFKRHDLFGRNRPAKSPTRSL